MISPYFAVAYTDLRLSRLPLQVPIQDVGDRGA